MDLRQFKTLIAIANLQSFTKAADELGYAQSTITTQIKLLEQELNVRLFERLGHNITLTQEGERFLQYAKQIVKLSAEAKNAVSSTGVPKGTLTIGAVESLCMIRMPKLLKEYRKCYPHVEITLKFGSTGEFRSMLRDNVIDVAFFLDKKVSSAEFVTGIEFQEPIVLLANPEHPLVSKKKVMPVDLTDQPLILTESDCSYRIAFENILNRYGVHPRSVMETGSVLAIKQFTMNGFGIAILPLVSVEKEIKQKQLALLNWKGPGIEVMTQVIYHKDKWMSTALKAFLEISEKMLPSE